MSEIIKDRFNDVRVCDVIKCARVQAGLTQNELADHFQYSRRSVASWEAGEREPTVAVFLSILEYCGVPDVYDAFGYSTVRGLSTEAIAFARRFDRLDQESHEFVAGILKREFNKVSKGAQQSTGIRKMNLQ